MPIDFPPPPLHIPLHALRLEGFMCSPGWPQTRDPPASASFANPTGVRHHNRLYVQAKVGGGCSLACFTFHLNHCYFWLWGIFCLQKRNFTAFNINTRLPANLRGSFVSSLSLGGVMLMQGCTVTHIARVTDDIYHTPLNQRRHMKEGSGPLVPGQGGSVRRALG